MVPRSTHVTPQKSKASTPKASPNSHSSNDKPPEGNHKPRENALSLVSAAYASDMHAAEVEEEYDPARPNEYDNYVTEKMHKRKMEQQEEEVTRVQEQEQPWDREEPKV